MTEKLKLPLVITNDDYEVEIRDQDNEHIASAWIADTRPANVALALHRAEVIKAALEADATKCHPDCLHPIYYGAIQHAAGCPKEAQYE